MLLSLWSLCLLATFTVILSYGVRQKLTLAKRLDERDKLKSLAESGIKKSILGLKILEDTYGENEEESWNLSMSEPEETALGDGTVSYAVIDEERRININVAKRPTMERLFTLVLGLDEKDAQELAASVIDWRDEDSMLTIPLGSAEDYEYRNFEYPYEARDKDFEIIDELLLVKGITSEFFQKIRDYITIYGDGKVNVNTATPEVLVILGLSGELADMIYAYRLGDDYESGTDDDRYFARHARIVPELSGYYDLSSSQLALLTQIVNGKLAVNSSIFNIESIARLNYRKYATRIDCIVDRSGTILYWSEPR